MESYLRCWLHGTRKDINTRWKAVYAKLISIYIAESRLSLRIDLVVKVPLTQNIFFAEMNLCTWSKRITAMFSLF